MTILHDAVDCRSCLAVRERLDELAICYRDEPRRADDPKAHTLVDDDRVFRGHPDMHAHVDELGEFARQWQRFQSDTCYLDDCG